MMEATPAPVVGSHGEPPSNPHRASLPDPPVLMDLEDPKAKLVGKDVVNGDVVKFHKPARVERISWTHELAATLIRAKLEYHIRVGGGTQDVSGRKKNIQWGVVCDIFTQHCNRVISLKQAQNKWNQLEKDYSMYNWAVANSGVDAEGKKNDATWFQLEEEQPYIVKWRHRRYELYEEMREYYARMAPADSEELMNGGGGIGQTAGGAQRSLGEEQHSDVVKLGKRPHVGVPERSNRKKRKTWEVEEIVAAIREGFNSCLAASSESANGTSIYAQALEIFASQMGQHSLEEQGYVIRCFRSDPTMARTYVDTPEVLRHAFVMDLLSHRS